MMRSLYLKAKTEELAFVANQQYRFKSILLATFLFLPLLLVAVNLVIFIQWLNYVIILLGMIVYAIMIIADIIYYKYLTYQTNHPFKHIIFYQMIENGFWVVILVVLAILIKGLLL